MTLEDYIQLQVQVSALLQLTQGIFAHLIADWIFQDDWMAKNKTDIRHDAAWGHGFIHTIALLFVFPIPIALAIGAIHIIIDTRKPIIWWQRVFKQTTDSPYAITVSVWLDQVLHILVIAFFVWLLAIVS